MPMDHEDPRCLFSNNIFFVVLVVNALLSLNILTIIKKNLSLGILSIFIEKQSEAIQQIVNRKSLIVNR